MWLCDGLNRKDLGKLVGYSDDENQRRLQMADGWSNICSRRFHDFLNSVLRSSLREKTLCLKTVGDLLLH